jgi:hypothetical protein
MVTVAEAAKLATRLVVRRVLVVRQVQVVQRVRRGVVTTEAPTSSVGSRMSKQERSLLHA